MRQYCATTSCWLLAIGLPSRAKEGAPSRERKRGTGLRASDRHGPAATASAANVIYILIIPVEEEEERTTRRRMLEALLRSSARQGKGATWLRSSSFLFGKYDTGIIFDCRCFSAQPEAAPVEKEDMVEVTVNGRPVSVPKGSNVLQACEAGGVDIPRYYYWH